MKTLLYANRAEPKSISVISILLLAAVGAITKLRCMHRECYIFASQNLCYYYIYFIFHNIHIPLYLYNGIKLFDICQQVKLRVIVSTSSNASTITQVLVPKSDNNNNNNI